LSGLIGLRPHPSKRTKYLRASTGGFSFSERDVFRLHDDLQASYC
jgi:hypothetical protein